MKKPKILNHLHGQDFTTTMESSYRLYSGPVQGEVIIQGDLHAQGNINIGNCMLQVVIRS